MLIHNETIRLYIGKLLVNWIAIASILITYVFNTLISEPTNAGFSIFLAVLCSILFMALCWLVGSFITLTFDKVDDVVEFLFIKPFEFIPSHYITDSRDLHNSIEVYGDRVIYFWAKITFLKWW